MNAQPNLGMQVATFENPMGIDGFEFVEFSAPAGQGESMHRYFRSMGFTATMRHKSRPITLYRQGGVNLTNVGIETWDAEKVDTYEIGAKASFRGGALSGYFNVAAFYNDFTDQQLVATLTPRPGCRAWPTFIRSIRSIRCFA